MKSLLKSLTGILFLLCCFHSAFGTHLYGGELFYTHVSGDKYTVTMVLYGDCSGSAFSALPTSSPQVKIYKGTTLFRTMDLKIMAPSSGVEITPLCPASLGTTTCNGGTIPGVKKFVYSDTITLTAASNWRFRSTGTMGSVASAGRSTSITNIFASSPGSTMSLEATLNNSSQANSSARYTTVPTPFFCINVPQEYNPGAVDSNTTDSLVYSLTDGLESTTGTVSYRTGYSATAPLASAAGTFSFNSGTGQLGFTPNLSQTSLVVYKVSEYRSGVLVGTSMREMNFIVLSTCSNKSPYGKITDVSKGTIVDNTTVNACKNDTLLTFNINPTDADGDTILMSVAGLPAGATLAISGSGTKTPISYFSWNTSSVSSGTYNFFVTYQDNGCPLSSKQTVAYTINILGKPAVSISEIKAATCVAKAFIELTPSGGTAPWIINVYAGTSFVKTFSFSTPSVRDSFAAGNYNFKITNSSGCFDELNYTINPPPNVSIKSFSATMPKCNGGKDGTITITGESGVAPYQYQADGGTFTSGTITGLAAGAHTVRIRDANYCTKDTTIVLSEPTKVAVFSIAFTAPLCNGYTNGTATIVGVNGTAPYTFNIDGGAFSSSGYFTGLAAGAHVVRISDINLCTKDTTFTLINPDTLSLKSFVKKSLCNTHSDGVITAIASGGVSPYQYAIGSGGFSTANIFTALAKGTYTILVKDANNCSKSFSVFVDDSIAVKTSITTQNISCFSGSNGQILLSPIVGKSPFTYAIGSGSFTASPAFSALTAGTYFIHIKDANGCIMDTNATLTQPSLLNINMTLKIPSCNAGADGSISVIGSGGVPAYTFSMDGKTFTAKSVFSDLASGKYTLYVKDFNSCTKDTSVFLDQPAALFINTIITPPLCNGQANGSVKIIGDGGTPEYLYSYGTATPGAESSISGLKSGYYKIILTDKNGCKKDTTVFINQPSRLSVDSVNIKHPTCENYVDGSAIIKVSGGIIPYKYALDNGSFFGANFFDKLKEGTYTLHISDSNNCAAEEKISLKGYEKIKMDSSKIEATKCFGSEDGEFKFYASGGNAPLRYSLINSRDTQNTAVYKNLKSSIYDITVTDAKKCFKNFSVFIPEPEKLKINTTITHNDCTGTDTSGRIILLVDGGTKPYYYRWSFNNSSYYYLAGLSNGFYAVLINDANNCIDSLKTEIYYDNCCTPSIPNAFTPNNDGRNDVIRMIYKGDIQLKEYSIYNRYGQKIFTTTNINDGWDGRFNNKEMELGVYYYYIRLICGNGKDHEVSFKGDITLIR